MDKSPELGHEVLFHPRAKPPTAAASASVCLRKDRENAVSMHVYIRERGECGLPSYHPRRQHARRMGCARRSAVERTAKHRMAPPFLDRRVRGEDTTLLERPE